jgi:VanZ family protein
MKSRRKLWLGRCAVLLLGLYWLALCTGTHIPQNALPAGTGNDKLLHFAAYFGLALLLCATSATQRVINWRVLAVLYLLLLGYGVLDELLQIPVPGRYAELNDWIADALGAAVGISCFALGYFYWQRKVVDLAKDPALREF